MTVIRPQGGRKALSLMSVLRRSRVEIGIVVLAVVAVITLVTIKQLQDSGGDSGPLEGDEGLAVTIPVRAGDTGVAWGNLELYNHSGSVIVLDRVVLPDVQGKLTLVRIPYIWGKDRLDVAHYRSLVAVQLPLPKEWSSVPIHAVAGYEIPPMPAGSGNGDETVIGPEIVIEVNPPPQAATARSIRVDYHVGETSYSKTFDNSLTVCPPKDLGPCASAHSDASPTATGQTV
jgi:hypothetical protein